MNSLNELVAGFAPLLKVYALSVGASLVTLIIGFWAVGVLGNILQRSLTRAKFDQTLGPYLVGLAKTALKTLVVISVIGQLGIQTTSFIAVLGAAGLAVGMALQGSLGNFAGGVLILIFKPFVKGDEIETLGLKGKVVAIEPFVTVLRGENDAIYFAPNGAVANGALKNFSASSRWSH